MTLSLDGSSYPSGYFPQAGDQVKVTYEKNKMAMKDIQLIYRATPDDGQDNQ